MKIKLKPPRMSKLFTVAGMNPFSVTCGMLMLLLLSCKKNNNIDEGSNNNGVWSQQGNKLKGSTDYSYQGSSVSLSADGNTLIFSVPTDDYYMGCSWIFTRDNGKWTQQGNKLVGLGANGRSYQSAVAISADGNTAIAGGSNDSTSGAAWVFVRNNGLWIQQGNKLKNTGSAFSGRLGHAVAISSDGNTAVVGGSIDKTAAAWVFTRSNGVW